MADSPELARVRRAVRRRAAADVEYRAALAAAVDAGHSLSVVGRAAGITKAGVRKITGGRPPGDQ